MTLGEFWIRWTTDVLFERKKESSNKHYRQQTAAFVAHFGHLRLDQPEGHWDAWVAEWLQDKSHHHQVPALRVLFADAMSAKGGRLVSSNPFSGLGLEQSKGRRDVQPPTEIEMVDLIVVAKRTDVGFARYLEFGASTGLRPGELDALLHTDIDRDTKQIHVSRQWNGKTQNFTEPKKGGYVAALTPPAEALLGARAALFHDPVFQTRKGEHWTPNSRRPVWDAVRKSAGVQTDLYSATRHYFGWYALNVLGLEPPVIAHQLGHKDGGDLVEKLYGHRDKARSHAAIRDAFSQRPGNSTKVHYSVGLDSV